MNMFLKNCWYVAAWNDEVTSQPKGYVFLDEPVLLFRKKDGTPVALEDRCAHRRVQLSKGYVRDDALVCGYHGLTYDSTGACIHIPGQQSIPSWARVKSYPVVERYKCIWIWMGDPERADEALMPDLSSADRPGWGDRDRLHVKCHYELVSDNLGDLSHLAYVHSANVGTVDLAEHGEVETQVKDGHVIISRWTTDRPPPPTYTAVAGFKTNIDRWQISDFSPPGFFQLNFGAAPAGSGRNARERSDRWGFQIHQWTTPETERTSHYFWAAAPDFGSERDVAAAKLYYPQQHIVVGEDIAIFEAQQINIERNPAAPIGAISADTAVIAARRMVAQLITDEAQHSNR